MTNNADQYTVESISENDIVANEDIFGTKEKILTESATSSAENGVTPRIIASTLSDAAVTKPWPAANDTNKIIQNGVTISMQAASSANESPSIDREQIHCDSRISFVDENISSQLTKILSEDNLEKGQSPEKQFENEMGEKADIGDENSSQINPSYDGDNCDDDSDWSHLNELDDPKTEADVQCALNNLKSGNQTPSHQEDSIWSFPEELPCEVRSCSNSDILVHEVDKDGNENPALSQPNVPEKGCVTTKTLLCEEEEVSKMFPTLDSLPEDFSEIINGAQICLDEIHEQEFTALLQSPPDGNRQSEVDSYPIAKRHEHDASESHDRENFEQRNSTDTTIKTRSEEEGIKKYADARDFWAPLPVTSGQLITDGNNLGANEDNISTQSDSESSGIGSFETDDIDEGPFPFLSEKEIGKKGARTKLTSVTMDDDSIITCFSRDVSVGGPSSEGEDSNVMESSISRIVKDKAKKKRVKFFVDWGRRTAMILCATLVIYAFGTLLGSMSHAIWNFNQETDDQLQQQGSGGGGDGEPP